MCYDSNRINEEVVIKLINYYKKMKQKWDKAYGYYEVFLSREDRSSIRAHAAEASFFLVLSLVPCLMLILTLMQFTPITKDNLVLAIMETFPNTINSMVVGIVDELYSQTKTTFSIALLTTLWSAGRGIQSITNGLNWVYDSVETRTYIYVRLRAIFYTLLFMASIILSLVVLIFGNHLSKLVEVYLPIMQALTEMLIEMRGVAAFIILFCVFLIGYWHLPNAKLRWKRQIPGAIFAAAGWMLTSLGVSIYVDYFHGFTATYGSLATVALVMLWFYFSMYIVLLGARINVFLFE